VAHDVFVSYSHHDKPQADAVCATLEAKGIRCWIAPRDVIPGQEWGAAIVDAIRSSRVMVLVFSSHSNDSPQIRREVQLAVNAETVLIPFRIEDVLPEKSLEYFLGTPHWLDALTAPLESHLERLAAAAASFLVAAEPAGQPTAEVRPSTPAAATVTTGGASTRPPTARMDLGESMLRKWAATGQWDKFDERIADLAYVKTINTVGWSELYPQLVQSAPVEQRDHLRSLPTVFAEMGWNLAHAGDDGNAVFMFYRALDAFGGLVNRDPSTASWLRQFLVELTDIRQDLSSYLFHVGLTSEHQAVSDYADIACIRLGEAINLVERAGLAVPERAVGWRDGMRQRWPHL
jgi:hypothetical protein